MNVITMTTARSAHHAKPIKIGDHSGDVTAHCQGVRASRLDVRSPGSTASGQVKGSARQLPTVRSERAVQRRRISCIGSLAHSNTAIWTH